MINWTENNHNSLQLALAQCKLNRTLQTYFKNYKTSGKIKLIVQACCVVSKGYYKITLRMIVTLPGIPENVSFNKKQNKSYSQKLNGTIAAVKQLVMTTKRFSVYINTTNTC